MIWRIAAGSLPTKDKLSMFVDATDTYCPLCKMETETSLHLFALWARLFRRIERAKRPFIKSHKSEYVWLGEICGIAFLNKQIFAFQEKKFLVAISISRDLQIVIPQKFFAENQK